MQACYPSNWVLGISSDACSRLWNCNGLASFHSSCFPCPVSICFWISNSDAIQPSIQQRFTNFSHPWWAQKRSRSSEQRMILKAGRSWLIQESSHLPRAVTNKTYSLLGFLLFFIGVAVVVRCIWVAFWVSSGNHLIFSRALMIVTRFNFPGCAWVFHVISANTSNSINQSRRVIRLRLEQLKFLILWSRLQNLSCGIMAICLQLRVIYQAWNENGYLT